MNPWLFQFGFGLVPNDARQELTALAYGLTPRAYLNKIWHSRRAGQRIPKPKSLSWPETIFSDGIYVLRANQETNVMPMRAKGRGK